MTRPVSAIGVVVLGIVSAAACVETPPRESQVLLVFRTDAPLPSARRTEAGNVALFDRLRVELFAPGSNEPCANCVETFTLEREAVDEGRASVGIVLGEGVVGHRVRTTLYFARGLPPRPRSSIVHVHALPALRRGELLSTHVVLRVAETGMPVGSLEAPVTLEAGEGAPIAAWPESVASGCERAASRPDAACVPGRAFWMGDPTLDVTSFDDEGGGLEHLVVVSPFFVDRKEVTVAELREAKVARYDNLGVLYDPNEDFGPGTYCTYRTTPGDTEGLPVTCVSRVVAAEYCAALGKRLPTEAELELVAGGLRQAPYVWGVDAPSCDDAVFGRVAQGACGGGGPRPAGSGKRDRIVIGGVEVLDLSGNVSEWVRDLWNRDDEGCFPGGVLRDPVCTTPSSDGTANVARGGGWWQRHLAPAAARVRVATEATREGTADGIGFRCVESAGP